MRVLRVTLIAVAVGFSTVAAAESAKPKPPAQPVMFDTAQADAILAAMAVVPPTSPWRQDISKLLVHPDSAAMVAHIGTDKHLACNRDMAFIIVPPNQPHVAVKLLEYPDESDPGPYPVPDNAPI